VTTREDNLLSELRSIRAALATSGASRTLPRFAAADRALGRMIQSLARPMRMAVLGEENSGKSLLVNYLLKHQVLPSGGFAGDSTELLIRYAPEPSVHSVNAEGVRTRLTSKAFGRLVKPETPRPAAASKVIYDAASAAPRDTEAGASAANLIIPTHSRPQAPSKLIEIGLPLGFLKRIEIVEVRAYPGGAATSPAASAFRKVDMTLWCTLATQAWKETEVVSWRRIPALHRKSALMLVTYKDAIRRGKDESKILARLRHSCAGLFDDVVLVSLRDALQSLLSADGGVAGKLRIDSNIEATEDAINAMIHRWQRRRFQKTAGVLQRLANAHEAFDRTRGLATGREFALKLERLAADFLNASPSLFLADEAA
jgi:hypothetical protein